jgi:hypothetical protein
MRWNHHASTTFSTLAGILLTVGTASASIDEEPKPDDMTQAQEEEQAKDDQEQAKEEDQDNDEDKPDVEATKDDVDTDVDTDDVDAKDETEPDTDDTAKLDDEAKKATDLAVYRFYEGSFDANDTADDWFYDRYDISAEAKGTEQGEEPVTEAATVEGRVVALKQVALPDSTDHNLVALILGEDGTNTVVDLGPADEADDLDLDIGDQLTVSGDKATVRGADIVIGKEAKTSDGQVAIDRAEQHRQFERAMRDAHDWMIPDEEG